MYFFYSGIKKRYQGSLCSCLERESWLQASVYVSVMGLYSFSLKLLKDQMNFLVRKPLFSLNRPRCDPKAVLLMSCILNLMILLGMEGMLMSKFVFIKLKLLLSNDKAPQRDINYAIPKYLEIMFIFKLEQKGYNFYSTMKKNSSLLGLNKSSWAGKHGISKQNNGSPLLGLNPNLNIEDQYIENLLKQIHFMTMEIKLLKEKQSQSEASSLWGVINRSSLPLVTNIVDSNQKYQTMKKQLDTDLNKNQYQNIRLADQQNAVLSKLNFLEKKIEGLGHARGEKAASAASRQEKLAEKTGEFQNKLKTLQAEREEESRKQMQLSGQYEALLLEVEKERFATGSEIGRIKNDEQIEEVIDAERGREVQILKDKMTLLKQSLQSSVEFQRAKEDQTTIRESIAQVLKSMAGSQFELMQVEASIGLANEQKEKEVIERKRLMEEFESLRVVLKEMETLNANRLSQEVANRKRDSLDIQKGETQTKKLEKNLQEIRKKLTRSEDSEKILKQQIEHLQRELAKLKQRRGELNESLTKLATANDKQDTELTNFRNQYRRVQEQYEKILQAQLTSTTELNDMETEIIYLRERKEYLSQALNLKEAINQTKLEQLQKVVQKNKDVNETVSVLMEKWQEIRNFTKM